MTSFHKKKCERKKVTVEKIPKLNLRAVSNTEAKLTFIHVK